MDTGPMSLLSVAISADYAGRKDVLRNVAFEIAPGEILGLAGQSGAGKSTIALAVLRLLELRSGAVRGRIVFRGRDISAYPQRAMRRIRGREIALVPQNPIASLNPVLTLEKHFREAWRAHAETPFQVEAALELLERVSLPRELAFLEQYPRQLSAGLAQRVLIALALVHQPELIIADEPTSALDLITQSELLALFARLNRELGTAMLYISHDLLSLAALCHRIAVLRAGEIVECGPTARIFEDPAHAYTRRLIGAIPRLEAAFAGQNV